MSTSPALPVALQHTTLAPPAYPSVGVAGSIQGDISAALIYKRAIVRVCVFVWDGVYPRYIDTTCACTCCKPVPVPVVLETLRC